MEQTKYDVFISYSRKDYVDEHKNVIPGNEVSKIKEALTEADITFWFDEEGMYSGENFIDKIVTNIKASKVFVFLSTKNANKSKWTPKEIATASELGKYIIPVRIDNSVYNEKVLFRIADLSYVAYYVNPEKGIQELTDSIKAYLAQLKEEELRQEEEASKRREAEKKKAEEEKKKLELEERRRIEEQKRIISDIKIACKKLNNDEEKIELERENLILLATQKVADANQQAEIKALITESSPIRRKQKIELDALRKKALQLELELSKIPEKDSEIEALKNHLNSTSKMINSLQSKVEYLNKSLQIKYDEIETLNDRLQKRQNHKIFKNRINKLKYTIIIPGITTLLFAITLCILYGKYADYWWPNERKILIVAICIYAVLLCCYYLPFIKRHFHE